MDTVFGRAAQELEESHDIMLVTVVGSAGSAPRKAGSCMIVGAEGRLVGTIGGGNIEYQSEIKARELLEQKATLLYPFVLNETATDGLGMMCGGTADVWFQYISAGNDAWRATIQATTQALASNKGGWLVLSLSGAEPCLLSTQKELLAGTMPADADALCASTCVRTDEFFSFPLPTKERAIIFGGGHISQALVPVLASVDFYPVVFDNRPEYTDPALFPCAGATILGDYLAISDSLELEPSDFAIIVTQSHAFDYEVQEQLLRHKLAYIGAIGSSRKTRTVREKLREAGIPEEKIMAVHMPVGTEIGAVTPAEIAISIVGEMIAVRAEQRAAQ